MLSPFRTRIRARLIPDVRQAHRLWSVRLMAAGAAVLGAWSEIPAEIRAALPIPSHVGAGLLLLSVAARLLKQGGDE